ncbi:galactose-1-phosphate uridylyltransferase [Fomitiporia mediterranea MF3/22]|uniref:galactose-1-phosphate uridylyltransferase n=1 Tax=Fomitiporia mediterranea (strain MF3/22) TaxID=694068 RepID=UPI000440902A|nr:galactose-1-phosphate uridylyltransferase [Fomitiporia mediterranea MF3/22]EJD08531.1 galactose-1-phosphate uridylyltransferase [Fomitiporia mediterranea MF3/22]
MDEFDPTQHTHRRYNPLTDEYILVSPHRARRPWLGQIEPPQPSSLPQYDPSCYLCPGNKRAGGHQNDAYTSTYTFNNDYAALAPAPVPPPPEPAHPLLAYNSVHGECDVIVFHPRHDLTLARLSLDDISIVIREWIRIYEERSKEEGIRYVQIFENKGAMMGCSNPHPHNQVWSMSDIPTIPAKEFASLLRYAQKPQESSQAPRGPENRPCLLCEYAHLEVNDSNGERIVSKNEDWVALVPWWATWPFEVLMLPYRRHIHSLPDLTPTELASFARILSEITLRYDNLFTCSFPYSMGIHQAPLSKAAAIAKNECLEEYSIAHLHLHFFPPLLRSASVRKFLVGFELMAEAQRDLTPEQGASRLRECALKHYADSLQ